MRVCFATKFAKPRNMAAISTATKIMSRASESSHSARISPPATAPHRRVPATRRAGRPSPESISITGYPSAAPTCAARMSSGAIESGNAVVKLTQGERISVRPLLPVLRNRTDAHKCVLAGSTRREASDCWTGPLSHNRRGSNARIASIESTDGCQERGCSAHEVEVGELAQLDHRREYHYCERVQG